MQAPVTVAAVVLLAASALTACGSSAPGPSSSSTSASATPSRGSDQPTQSYQLGREDVYKQAFQQFTGTGTPWPKACQAVVDKREAIDGSQPWWNRDEVLRGCLDRGEEAAASGTATPVAPAAPLMVCAPKGDHQIKIRQGGVSCAEAYALADRYDPNGEKYQQFDDLWTCYHGITDVPPLVLTCVSERGDGMEFEVDQAL